MENCSICNLNYNKSFKSDHYKTVKLLEKSNQNFCKKCNLYMPLRDKDSYLSSDDHKQRTKQLHVWCEDCGKEVSD